MEHHVYFWLKEEHQNEDDRAAFESGLDDLCRSENIAEPKWGKPAATAERPVTDHSWGLRNFAEVRVPRDSQCLPR